MATATAMLIPTVTSDIADMNVAIPSGKLCTPMAMAVNSPYPHQLRGLSGHVLPLMLLLPALAFGFVRVPRIRDSSVPPSSAHEGCPPTEVSCQ
ncbi:MAG: hypothetical protein MZV63_61430 [Marinilabiliales bacterium]|nr:hypothetical protein [Marinilabiliales bacterium]